MVSIDYDRTTLVLTMPFHGECISLLKEVIPQQARTWDPNTKSWFIAPGYFLRLMQVLRLYFEDEHIFISENVPGFASLGELIEAGISRKLSGPWQELYLQPDAPPELVKVAYKTLAKLYHPDHIGGDEERMKRLNLAYERINGN